MIRIGLTGSIGMGKSTVAEMFRQFGVPVFDADAAVHALQGPGGAALAAIEARFPGSTGPHGIDRRTLGERVIGHPVELRALEAILHPAVARHRADFLRQHKARDAIVLDIPLLFEKGGYRNVDLVVVVSAPFFVQRRRVLARTGMSEARFRGILARQLPDHEKRRRADVVIETARPLWQTRRAVEKVVQCL